MLDEADEMLRMGFIEDVETIMAQIPEGHQTALFSRHHAGKRFVAYPPLYERAAGGSAHSVSVTTRPDIMLLGTVWGMRKTKRWCVSRKRKTLMRRLSSYVPKRDLEVAALGFSSSYNSAALNGDMNGRCVVNWNA